MLGLLSLAVAVKPLADIVAGYTCCDRHKESDEIFHALTSFLLPDWRRAEESFYYLSAKSVSFYCIIEQYQC